MPIFSAASVVYINVKDFGAKGDGTSDDTTAITNAIAALPNSKGAVFFPPGTYITTLQTLGTGQWFIGSGYESTVLKLKNSANSDLVQTTNFGTLTGTDTSATPYNLGIIGMTLDGNKANNASGGNCLSIYAYGYTLRDIRLRNANSWGLWTEWGQLSQSPGNDSMEAYCTDFKIHDCKAGGLRMKGPHDTQFVNGIVYNNGNGTGTSSIVVPTDQYGSGSMFSMIHVWGGNYDYAFDIACTGISIVDCQVEGSLLAQVRLSANNCDVIGCKFLAGGVNTNTVKGIVINNNAVNACIKACKMENMGGGVVDVTSSGGDNSIEVFADYYSNNTVPSPAIIGSVDANSTVILHILNNGGISTSDSTLTFPGSIKNGGFTAAGSYGGGVGINTGANSGIGLVVGTGADGNHGIVVFGNSNGQSGKLIKAQNSSFVDEFTVDNAGNVVAQGSVQVQGAATIYSGSGAPSNSNGNNGDFYFRTGTPGTSNQRLYVKSAGAWSGIL